MLFTRRWVFFKTYLGLGVANLIIRQGLVEGVPDEFTLTLHVRVPPTTGFLMHYWQSPTVVIDQYTGDSHNRLSPQWLKTVQTECKFWQSRTLMLEMMLYFVRSIPHNSRVSTRVRSWCSAMSVSNLLWAGRVTLTSIRRYLHGVLSVLSLILIPSRNTIRVATSHRHMICLLKSHRSWERLSTRGHHCGERGSKDSLWQFGFKIPNEKASACLRYKLLCYCET